MYSGGGCKWLHMEIVMNKSNFRRTRCKSLLESPTEYNNLISVKELDGGADFWEKGRRFSRKKREHG